MNAAEGGPQLTLTGMGVQQFVGMMRRNQGMIGASSAALHFRCPIGDLAQPLPDQKTLQEPLTKSLNKGEIGFGSVKVSSDN
jgi:hypothetical protein